VVDCDAQDPAHFQTEPHHLARRLHRFALRQERAAGRHRYGHRGDRHPSYISLQLKAVSTSYSILVQYPEIVLPAQHADEAIRQDTALWVALILAAFTIAFGTRHLDAAEHHQGMVAAIAFESLVKLLASWRSASS